MFWDLVTNVGIGLLVPITWVVALDGYQNILKRDLRFIAYGAASGIAYRVAGAEADASLRVGLAFWVAAYIAFVAVELYNMPKD